MHRVARLAFLFVLVGCGGGSDDPQPAAPAPAPSPSDSSCGLPDFQAQAVALINQRRAAGADCGSQGRFEPAPPLQWNDRLAAAAHGHSLDMAQHDYFAHEGRDGRRVGDRVEAAGYAWRAVGENLAGGPRSVAAAVDGWMASDGHCANMMHRAWREMGLACVAAGGSTYGRYWTLNLAEPR